MENVFCLFPNAWKLVEVPLLSMRETMKRYQLVMRNDGVAA